MIEQNFDISFIADLALREKQIQQNYRPIIAVHKWFARRPGTLFRGLLLSEFVNYPLKEAFFHSNELEGIKIADPFMGGGIPLIEANRIGCEIIGYDINPMSYWIVKQEIEHLDLEAYKKVSAKLRHSLEQEIGHLYRTTCLECGNSKAHIKYFLWNKIKSCVHCGHDMDLFPGYQIAQNRRHPKHVFVCSECGNLTETDSSENPGICINCKRPLKSKGPAKRSRCLCPECGKLNKFPDSNSGPPQHRLYAIEYYCPVCKAGHKGRFFKKPDLDDFTHLDEAESRLKNMRPRFIPDDTIPKGDESSRLHRWGYNQYREMFNSRQLLGLELGCRFISEEQDNRIKHALATNLSDLLRYQNMLCRYDKMALKSLDIFSVHGFPVGLLQCESNLLGIYGEKNGHCVGSGGWANIIEKYSRAKAYCDKPFEVTHRGKTKRIVRVVDEWIGDIRNNGTEKQRKKINLFCSNAREKKLLPNSLDGVFTDPPYFGNVQYAELMDFCYVWLKKLLGASVNVFKPGSTRHIHELTGNENMGRGIEDFTEGISQTFQNMTNALKPGSPLVFTYHHNDLKAYYAIAVAILDSGLTCSASIPCPAEMGASIHINGTGSSIIDTIFVCRQTGKFPRKWLPENPEDLSILVFEDIANLKKGNVKPNSGDVKCIIYGHLIRLAIWHLRENWNRKKTTSKKMNAVDNWINKFGGLNIVLDFMQLDLEKNKPVSSSLMIREQESSYTIQECDISF